LNPPDAATLQQRIDRIFQAVTPADAPGCVVGVQQGGQPLFRGAYGLASLELGVPLSPCTRFRVASVSKQFTVTALLMLAAQGRLSLDDEIRAHLPELAPLPQPVTLEHLMRNTSGLPDFLEMLRLGGVGLDADIDRAAMLRCIAGNRHLNFAPGSRFLYSNTNFLLLGLVVERTAGCSLGDFLQQRVFAPLGMRHTVLEVAPDRPLPGLATPYVPDGSGGWRRARHGFEHGGEGGLVSCVDDLLLWTAALGRDEPGPLPAGLLAQLSSPTRLTQGADSPYARGLEHSRLDGRRCVGHAGLWPGFRTELLYLPDEALCVVVISNSLASNPYLLARQVAKVLLGAQTVLPAPSLEGLEGRWLCAEEPAQFDLAVRDGELYATQWGAPFQLEPQADGGWLPLRGAYEFRLCRLDAQTLQVDLGAGQRARFRRLGGAVPLPDDLAGDYRCDDIAADWHIDEDGTLLLGGPHKAGVRWQLRGLQPDLLEVLGHSGGMPSAQLARLERDAAGPVVALQLDTSRIRGLRFERVTAAAPARRG
jgi:D-aminopeptidase